MHGWSFKIGKGEVEHHELLLLLINFAIFIYPHIHNHQEIYSHTLLATEMELNVEFTVFNLYSLVCIF